MQLAPDPIWREPAGAHSLAPHVPVPARLAQRVSREQQARPLDRPFLHRLRQAPVRAAGITDGGEAPPAWQEGGGDRGQLQERAGGPSAHRCAAQLQACHATCIQQTRCHACSMAHQHSAGTHCSMPSSTLAARAVTRLSGRDSRPGRFAVHAVTWTWASHRPAHCRQDAHWLAQTQHTDGQAGLQVQHHASTSPGMSVRPRQSTSCIVHPWHCTGCRALREDSSSVTCVMTRARAAACGVAGGGCRPGPLMAAIFSSMISTSSGSSLSTPATTSSTRQFRSRSADGIERGLPLQDRAASVGWRDADLFGRLLSVWMHCKLARSRGGAQRRRRQSGGGTSRHRGGRAKFQQLVRREIARGRSGSPRRRAESGHRSVGRETECSEYLQPPQDHEGLRWATGMPPKLASRQHERGGRPPLLVVAATGAVAPWMHPFDRMSRVHT